MNKKIIILIITVLFSIIIISLLLSSKDDVKEENIYREETNLETGNYYLINTVTNEIIIETEDKANLQKFIDNPDYNPDPIF